MDISTTGVLPEQEYEVVGVVQANVVLGTNVFKEMFGSVTDFLGGRSGTYEKVLDDGNIKALERLAEKAEKSNAQIDAIVGVSMDFEVINQMISFSAIGTAIKYK